MDGTIVFFLLYLYRYLNRLKILFFFFISCKVLYVVVLESGNKNHFVSFDGFAFLPLWFRYICM